MRHDAEFALNEGGRTRIVLATNPLFDAVLRNGISPVMLESLHFGTRLIYGAIRRIAM